MKSRRERSKITIHEKLQPFLQCLSAIYCWSLLLKVTFTSAGEEVIPLGSQASGSSRPLSGVCLSSASLARGEVLRGPKFAQICGVGVPLPQH